MSYYEVISCRLAIQVCIGYSPSGRKRHRTFSMKGIRPDASDEAIGAILRALAPLLIYPITKVRKVTKRTIFFNNSAAPAACPRLAGTPSVAYSCPARAYVPELVEPEIPFWEVREGEKFVLAQLAMYLLWAWVFTRVPIKRGQADRLRGASALHVISFWICFQKVVIIMLFLDILLLFLPISAKVQIVCF